VRWRWRRPRFRRKPVLITLGVVLTVLLGGGFFVLGTTGGARWAIGLALDRAPQEVTIEQIDGQLTGPLTLRGIRAVTPLAEVDVGLVELDWAPGELFSRRVHVERFVVEDVAVRMLPAPPDTAPAEPSPPPEPIPPPAIPLEIVIDEARISGVHLLLEGDVALTEVQLGMHGRPDDYQVEMSARLSGEAIPPTEMAMQMRGGLSSLVVDPFTVQTLAGTVVARAEAAWYPEITWQATIHADSLAVGQLAPQPEQWPGHLDAGLSTAGRLEAGEPVGWAALDTLSGELRGHAVGGHGRVDFAGLTRADLAFDLAWATFLADITAAVGDSVTADLHVACPDLAPVLPQAAGHVDVAAQVRGPLRTPRAVATVRVDSLSLPAQGAAVARVAADVDVDLADGGTGTIAAEVLGLAAGSAVLDTTRLTADGSRTEQRVRLAFAGPQIRGLLALAGTLDPDSLVWAGAIDTLDLANPQVGAWRLAQPVHLVAGATAASLDSLRLVHDESALALGGAWTPDGWSGAGAIERFPLAVANDFLPPEQTLHGLVEATFRASGTPAGDVAGELAAALTDTRLVFAVAGTPDSLVFEDAALRAAMGDSGVTAGLDLTILGASTGARVALQGNVELPEYTNVAADPLTQPLTAKLRGDLPDLGVFEGLDPRATGLGGSVTLAVDADGTVGEPAVEGELRATGLTVTVPDLGITVTDGELVAAGDPAQGFSLSGGARSGDGEIRIEGDIPAKPTPATPVAVTITGERFQGMGTPEIQVLVSPDLKIAYDSERLDVTGTVTLPVIQVELVEVPESAVPVSRDVVVVDEEAEPAAPPVDTWVDVQVVLGDDVEFRGFAVSIELEGAVNVKQHAPKPPQVRGDIRIREGYYRAYGQNLTFDEGTISFVGPAENPNLNMKAYREAADGTIAGLRITGTAEQPEIQIYSEPAMPAAEAISYLVTGHGPREGGGGGMAGAAALLGSNVLSSAVGSKVGLDEARIETGEDKDDAALVTGKYITPDLYLSYAMGLFERSNLVRLRYILSPKWAVQTETGTTQGADVFYKIEFGGE